MSEPVFVYQAAGQQFPERLSVTMRNGLAQFMLRGEPRPGEDGLIEGPTAVMTLPLRNLVELSQALLALPPLEEIMGARPFVLYFDGEANRQAFIRELRKVVPDMVDQAL